MRRYWHSRRWKQIFLSFAILAVMFGGPAPTLFARAVPERGPGFIQDVPGDPVEAAQALVEQIYGPDEAQAQAATIELLRRAGLPVVSINGPVIALPDHRVLEDAAVYAELVPDLTRSVREGDFYTPSDFTELLMGTELSSAPLPVEAIIAGLGQWGKQAGAPFESQFAGAAVRALAGRRLDVLYAGADLDTIRIDPLQTVLILAHATSRERTVLEPNSSLLPAGWLFGAMPAAAQGGPCDDLEKALTPTNEIEEVVSDEVQEQLIDSWKEFVFSEAARNAIGKGEAVYSKGSAILNIVLLMLGAQIELSDNKGGVTHFKHAEGSRAEHVVLAAVAYFDSNIARQKVACYRLAGIDVPPPGPMEGFKVRWSVDQRLGRGYQGKYLAVVPADDHKLDACGTCGDVTGPDGRSFLELYPPVERKPGVGDELTGYVRVKASLDKSDFPFKLGDLLALKNPAGFMSAKIWDLTVSALSRAGLPSASRSIRVDYHGADIFIAMGSSSLFLIYLTAPVELDIYTCEGLSGNWHGHGGLGGDDTTFFGDLLELVSGEDIPEGVTYLRDFNFQINPEAEESVFDILPEMQMTGVLRISQARLGINQAEAVGRQVGRPVGEVEVLIAGESMSMLDFTGGGTVYPVYWIPEDSRCPAGGYDFETNP